jgi:hypothetical protein
MRASKRICVSVIREPEILLLSADRALDTHDWQNPGALPKFAFRKLWFVEGRDATRC